MKSYEVNGHTFEINNCDGHQEATENGVFVVSGDTVREVEESLDEMYG